MEEALDLSSDSMLNNNHNNNNKYLDCEESAGSVFGIPTNQKMEVMSQFQTPSYISTSDIFISRNVTASSPFSQLEFIIISSSFNSENLKVISS